MACCTTHSPHDLARSCLGQACSKKGNVAISSQVYEHMWTLDASRAHAQHAICGAVYHMPGILAVPSVLFRLTLMPAGCCSCSALYNVTHFASRGYHAYSIPKSASTQCAWQSWLLRCCPDHTQKQPIVCSCAALRLAETQTLTVQSAYCTKQTHPFGTQCSTTGAARPHSTKPATHLAPSGSRLAPQMPQSAVAPLATTPSSRHRWPPRRLQVGRSSRCPSP